MHGITFLLAVFRNGINTRLRIDQSSGFSEDELKQRNSAARDGMQQ